MSLLRYRDDEPSTTTTVLGVLLGAAAGFAVGMLVSQRVGGFTGLSRRLRRRAGMHVGNGADGARAAQFTADVDDDEFEDVEEDDIETEGYDEELEDRVLEAFRNDPILCERAVDIGSIGEGVIELAGWVENEKESQHAVTIARGVPDVVTVVNRIAIGDEERRFEENAERVRAGDPALTEAQWDGAGVGTGRRRQGNSTEPDRHETPKQPLEERWQRADKAIQNAADDTIGLAERRSRGKGAARGDRAPDSIEEPRSS